jgi:hypothetical protein
LSILPGEAVRCEAAMTADPDVVALLISGIAGEVDQAGFDAAVEASSEADRLQAARQLATAARSKATPILSLNRTELLLMSVAVFRAAHGLAWLADVLGPTWASWPDKPLTDILKIIPRERIEYLRAELAAVGVMLDDAGSS